MCIFCISLPFILSAVILLEIGQQSHHSTTLPPSCIQTLAAFSIFVDFSELTNLLKSPEAEPFLKCLILLKTVGGLRFSGRALPHISNSWHEFNVVLLFLYMFFLSFRFCQGHFVLWWFSVGFLFIFYCNSFWLFLLLCFLLILIHVSFPNDLCSCVSRFILKVPSPPYVLCHYVSTPVSSSFHISYYYVHRCMCSLCSLSHHWVHLVPMFRSTPGCS